MNATETRQELLRDALEEMKAHGATWESISVRSLLASMPDEPILIRIVEDVFAPEGAVFDFHLDGPGVEGHRAPAVHFGLFIRHLAEATKEIAKQSTDRLRMTADLQIMPLFAGSVGVRLVVPTRVESYGTGKMFEFSDAESDALRQVGSLITAASDDMLDNELATYVEPLSGHARQALRAAVKEQVVARWEIAGAVTQPGQETVRVRSSQRGAQRLWTELERLDQKTEILERRGRVDGYKHSLHTMWFVDEAKDKYSIAVPSAELMLAVAQLGSDPDQLVRVVIGVTTKTPPGDSSSMSFARTLQIIEPA